MNEKLSLRELLAMIPAASNKRVPGKCALRASASPAAAFEETGLKITVFASGYALAELGKRWTVFSVAECGEYKYDTDDLEYSRDEDFQHEFDAEYFMDLPWNIRLSMMAEDRLENNNDRAFDGLISKHPGYIENNPWLRGWDASAEDVVIAEMIREEMLPRLTPKQRQTVEMWLDGYSGKEIARAKKVTQSTVSYHLHQALRTLNKIQE